MTVTDIPAHNDAPLTLAGETPKPLGLRDSLGLWGNLGISLLLPVAAGLVILPGSPFGPTLLAIVVGAVIGSVLLGLGAAAGAREGVPAMVLMRGLLGRYGSALPTVLNILQCVGWATFEIVIIASAASAVTGAPKWPFLLGAGVLATLMALRPLGSVRVLARYAVWVALAGVVYLFVRVLSSPLPDFTAATATATSFWTAADIVIALPVSWFPLAADYTRHVRSGRSAFTGAAVGYGVATIAFFALGIFALAAYPSQDVITALLAIPAGALAVLILVFVEVDEAFANVYSTAVSAQNIVPKLDRRLLALVVGAVATVLAFTFDIVGYEAFLFLIGAVFVPLVGVFAVTYFLVPRGAWDTSAQARFRPALLLPWVLGFVAYQLTTPTWFEGAGEGWTLWWTQRQADLGLTALSGFSASLVSLGVAAVLTVLVSLPQLVRGRRVA